MRTVWKYELNVGYFAWVGLKIPMGAKPLHVSKQDRIACLWCEIPDTEETLMQELTVYCIPTGEEMTNDLFHLGTVVMETAEVFHFYARRTHYDPINAPQ